MSIRAVTEPDTHAGVATVVEGFFDCLRVHQSRGGFAGRQPFGGAGEVNCWSAFESSS
jgi:hypothetical protein